MAQLWVPWGLVGDPKILDSLFWRVQTRVMKKPTCRHQQFAVHLGAAHVLTPAQSRCQHCIPQPCSRDK